MNIEKWKMKNKKRKMKKRNKPTLPCSPILSGPIWLDTDYALPKSDTRLKALLVLHAQNENSF